MAHLKDLRIWIVVAALVVVLLFGFSCASVRYGTTVIGNYPSPDGKWDALLMVRNGGAMTSYATQISIAEGGNRFARELALFRAPNLFVVDDNDGAVRWGDRGQIDVKLSWVSGTQLMVSYPDKSRVTKQEPAFRSVRIQYVPAK